MTAIKWKNGVRSDWSPAADWATRTVPAGGDAATLADNGTYAVTISIAGAGSSVALPTEPMGLIREKITGDIPGIAHRAGLASSRSGPSASALSGPGSQTFGLGTSTDESTLRQSRGVAKGGKTLASPSTFDSNGSKISGLGTVPFYGSSTSFGAGSNGVAASFGANAPWQNSTKMGDRGLDASNTSLPSGSVVIGSVGTLSIYYLAGSGNSLDFFATDGTTAGTAPLGDFAPSLPATGLILGAALSNCNLGLNFVVSGISVQIDTNPNEYSVVVNWDTDLYNTNGTATGTQLLTDLPGSDGVSLVGETGNITLFETVEGEITIKNPNNVPITYYPENFTPQLYETDGTQSGTRVLSASWIQNLSGDWGVASNWSPAVVPNSSSVNVLIQAGSGTVTVESSESFAINSMTLFSGLVLLDGELNAPSTSQSDENFVIAGGTLVVGSGVHALPGLDMTGGELDVAASGALSTSGTASVSSNIFLGAGSTWTNGGVVNLNAAGEVYTGSGAASGGTAAFVNQVGADFNFAADGIGVLNYNGTNGLFTNAGTLAKAGGTLTSNIDLVLNNTGLINVASGTIELDGGGSLTGSLSGAGTLLLANGTFTTGTGSLISTGHLAIDGGTLAGPGTISVVGTTTIVDASNAAAAFLGGDVTWLNKGTVNDGSLIYLNTSANDTVTITNASGANFNLTTDDARFAFDNGGAADTFTNSGTLAKTGGTLTSNIDLALNNTGLINVASGTIELDGGGSLTGSLSGAGTLLLANGTFTTGAGSLTSTGHLAIDGGTLAGPGTISILGTTTIVDTGGPVAALLGGDVTWLNKGTVNDGGLIYLNTSTSDTVTITNAAGASFNLTTDDARLAFYNGGGTDTFTNAGTLAKTGGTLTSYIAPTLNNTGLINVASGTIELDGGGSLTGSLSGAGTLLLADGTFTTGAGSLTSTGHLAIDGGTLAGPGTISIVGTTTIVDTGGPVAAFLGGDVTWLNKGTVNDGGLIYLNTSTSDTVTITNAAGASFNLTTDDARLAFYNGGGTDTFTNAGTLAKSGGTLTSYIAPTLNNTGLINVASGTIELDGGGSLGGTVSGAGTLALGGSGTFTSNGGTLPGSGNLAIYGDADLAIASGKTLTLSDPLSFGIAGTYDSPGFLTGPGTLTTTGTTTINSYSTYTYPDAELGGDITWVNSGTVNDSGTIYINTSNTDTVTIVNHAGASFDLTSGDASLVNQYGNITDVFTNAGTLAATSGVTGTIATIGITVNNTGLISVASGATLQLDGGGSLGGTVSGAGTLALGGGTFTSNGGTLPGSGNLAIYGDADLAIASGKTLTLSDPLSFGIAGTYDSPGFLTGPGTLTTTGTTTINSYSTYTYPDAELGGDITWVNSGTVNDSGTIYINTSNTDTVTIVNHAGASFDLTSGDASLVNQYGNITDVFTNAGTLAATSGVTGTIATIGITVNNTGLISVASGATLQLDGGGSLGGTVSGAGTLALGGGTFTSNGGTLLGSGNLAVYGDADLAIASGKTLTLSDPLSFGIAGTYDSLGFLTGPGTLTTTGTTTINSYSTYTYPDAELGGDITWVNSGTVNDSGTIYINTSSTDTVTILNQAGATFDLTSSDASLVNQYGNITDVFTNAGTLAATSGVAGTITTIGITVNNTGLISVASGATLQLDGGGSLGGTVSGAGTLALGGGTFTSTAAVLKGSPSLAIDGGTLTVSGSSGTLSTAFALNADGSLDIAGGTDLTLSGALSFGVAGTYDSPGFLTGPGTLTTTGTTTINSYSTYTYPDAELGGDITWVNSGTVNDSGTIYINTSSTDTVTILNQAGATFDLTSSDASLVNQYGNITDVFTNAGTLAATSGVAGTLATIGITVNNTGLISVASGATLQLDGGGSLGGTVSGAGTLALGGGTFTSNGGTLLGSGNLAVYGDADLAIASGKTLTLSDPLSFGIAGTYDSLGFLTGPGTLTTTGTTTINSYSTYTYPDAELGGDITWVNSGTVNDSGTIYINTSSTDTVTILNQAGATFDLTSSDASLVNQYGNITDVFTNAGTLAATSGVAGTITTIGITVNNTGLISVASGATLQLDGGGSLGGTVSGAGTLALGGGTFTSTAAVLKGSPSLAIDGGTLTVSGSSGTLSTAFALNADGSLDIAGGTDLTLSGALSFGVAGTYDSPGFLTGPGTLTTTGTTTINSYSTYTYPDAELGGDITWVNSGTVNDSGTIYINTSSTDTVTILNQAGATFDLTSSDASLVNQYGNITDVFTNAGTLAATSGVAGTLATIGITVNNTGLISVASGATLELDGGGSLGGTVSGAGTLALGGSGTFTSNGGSFLGTGNLAIYGYGDLAIASGKTLILSDPLSFGSTSSLYSTGFLTGPGTLTTTGTTTINSYSTYTYPDAELGGGITWINSGTVIDTGTIYINTLSTDTVTILNQAGATFDLTSGDASLVNQYGNITDVFTNAGTLAATSGVAGTLATIGITVNNTGLISVASGATLQLDGGGSLGGTLSGAGTLALEGGAFTSTVAILKGATNLAFDGGALTVSGASGTLATAIALSAGSSVNIASGLNLTLSGALSFGSATGNGPGYLTGPGTLTTTGTTTINDYEGNPEAYLGGGITWMNSGTVNDVGRFYTNTVSNDTVTIVNQAGASFNLTSGDASLYNQYGNGTDLFSNAGTLAATSGVSGTIATIGIAVNNTGLISATAGTLALYSTVTNTGKLLATTGGVLSLASGTLTNLPGTTLSGGAYEADAASTIEFSNNTSIVTDSASITLSGTGSAIEALNTSTSTQITLDSTLDAIAAGGTLTLLTGRNFTASGDHGSFATSGQLSLGGVSFSATKLAVNGLGTVSGYGTLNGAITDAGRINASGGKLLVNSTVSGTGALSASAGAILDLTKGGALTESISGSGTLQLDGATPYTLAGVIVAIASDTIDAGVTLSGTGTLTGSIAAAGTLAAAGGTLVLSGPFSGVGTLQAASGAVLDVAGGGSFGGIVSGAGTVRLDGASPLVLLTTGSLTATSVTVDAGATLDFSQGGSLAGTVAGAGTLKLDGAAAYTLAAGTTPGIANLLIATGTTLSGTGTLTSALADSGTLSASSATLTTAGAVTGAGVLSAAAGAVLDVAGGGTFTGAISGAGTLRLDGAKPFVLQTGASLAMSAVAVDAGAILDLTQGGSLASTLSGAGTLQLDGVTPYTLGIAAPAVSTLLVDTGATLSGSGTITGALIDNGTLSAASGMLVVDGALSGTGSIALASGAVLDLRGGATLTQTISGPGTLQLDAATYTLTGTTLAELRNIVDAGTTLSGIGTVSGTLADAGTISAVGGTLSLGVTTGTGTLAAAAGASIDLVAGGALTEAISGAGTLRLDGSVGYTLTNNNIKTTTTLIGAGTTLTGANSNIYGALTDTGTVVAKAGTSLGARGVFGGSGTLSASTGGTLDFLGGGSFTGAVSGAGTLKLDSTSYSLLTTLATGTVAVDAGASLSGSGAITGILADAGSVAASGSTLVVGSVSGAGTLSAGAGAVLDLTGGGTLGESFGGAGTLELNSATGFTLAGGTLATGTIQISAGSSLTGYGSVIGTLADAGAITATGGTLDFAGGGILAGVVSGTGTVKLDGSIAYAAQAGSLSVASVMVDAGATLALSGGGTLTGNIAGAGALQLGTGTYTLTGANEAVANFALLAGATLSGFGTIAGKLSDVGTLSASGGVLDLSGGGTFAGAVNGTGTLQLDAQSYSFGGGTLAAANLAVDAGATLSATGTISGKLVDAGTLTASSGTLKLGSVSGTGSLLASAGAILDLTAGTALTEAIGGPGTLQLDTGTYTLSGQKLAVASVLLDAGATLSGNGTVSGILTDSGSLAVSGGTLNVLGAFSGATPASIAANATLDLFDGGSLAGSVSGAGTLQLDGSAATTLTAKALSVGVINVDAGATLSSVGTSAITGAVTDAGVLAASSGSLTVSKAVSGSGTLLAATGAVLHLQGGGALGESVLGTGEVLLDGTYSFAGTTPLTVTTLVIDYGASLSATGTIASKVNVPGTLTAANGTLVMTGSVGGNGTLQAASGAVMDLKASTTLPKALTGAGTIKLDGASYAYGTATTSTVATLAVDAGVRLSGAGAIASSVTDAGSINAASGTLLLSGAVSGAGVLSASAGAVLDLTAGGTLTQAISGAGTLALGGAYTLGTAAPKIGAVRIDAAGALSGAGTISSAVTNTGIVAATSGTLSFIGAVTNNGISDAASGLLSFKNTVLGTGTLEIASQGGLSLLAGSAAGQMVDFLGSSGVLNLTQPSTFLGSIAGFAGSDTVDLINIASNGFAYTPGTNGGVLTVTEGTDTVATLNLAGNYTSSSFSLTTDGHGGTSISFV